jgi:phosphotransferase system HPr (HPr) family protein
MVNKKVVINYKEGLHLRPAKDIAEAASQFSCNIFLTMGELTVNCKSILGIVELAANYQSEIIVTAEGEDEIEALDKLTFIIENGNKGVSKDESNKGTN